MKDAERTTQQVALQFQALLVKIEPHLTSRQLAWCREVRITWNSRLRTAIGRAYFRENRIELSSLLISRFPQELEATLAHELAHLWAPLLYGRAGMGHQIGWRKTMAILGYPPERTHQLPLPRSTHSPVAFANCACPGLAHPIKALRYRKMTRTRRRQEYVCRHCGQKIILELEATSAGAVAERV
jgi:predicted SprT family Zn-dependent metalloprotease